MNYQTLLKNSLKMNNNEILELISKIKLLRKKKTVITWDEWNY
jgi:hypothetical protein